MDKYKMTSINKDISVFDNIVDAKNSKESRIRLELQGQRLKILPNEIFELSHVPYLELDLSYNSGLQINKVLAQLSQLPNLRGLALMRIEFGDLPDGIGQLTGLESLILWGNKCTKLPESFSSLKDLRYLILRTNPFKQIPAVLLELPKLEYLNLRYTEINKITPEFCSAMQHCLKVLKISDTKFGKLPKEMALLQQLRVLEFNSCNFANFPTVLSELPELEVVEYYGNRKLDPRSALEVIPKLKKLKTLDLSFLNLNDLPEFVLEMKDLVRLNIENNNIKTLPEALGDFEFLEELKISYNPDFQFADLWKSIEKGKYKALDTKHLPKIYKKADNQLEFSKNLEELHLNLEKTPEIPLNITQLKNLKRLSISYYSNDNAVCPLVELPDFFEEFEALESFSVWNLGKLKTLPPSLYRNKTLEKISIGIKGIKFDFQQLAQMPALTYFSAPISKNDVEKLPLLTNIQSLSLSNPDVEILPKGMRDLKNLTNFGFEGFPNLNYEDAITKLPYLTQFYANKRTDIPSNLHTLKQLKKVEYYVCEIKDLLELVEKSDSLKELKCTSAKGNFPPNILSFNRLDSCELGSSGINTLLNPAKANLPIEMALLDLEKVNLKKFSPIRHELKILEKVRDFAFDTDKKKLIAYALLLGQNEMFPELFENPFSKNSSLEGLNIYIFGTPTFSTLKELQANLVQRGAKIAKKIDENTTHILLSGKLPDDIAPIINAERPIILEDYFKAQIFSEDMPYLMEDVNQELVEHITRLLKALDTDDNLPLMLELIEGGGANKIIVSYLYIIHLFHFDLEVRKKSRKLFRKYASAELQTFLKNNWKDSFKDKNFMDYPQSLFVHNDLDFFACLLASCIVDYKTKIHKGIPHDSAKYSLQNIRLKDYDMPNISETFKDIDFAESLFIWGKGQLFDFSSSYPNTKNNNLKSISLQQLTLKEFPKEAFHFKNLESLTLSGIYNAKNTLFVPILPPSNSIRNINFQNIDFENPESFGNNFDNAKTLYLYNTNLSGYLYLFRGATNLEKLSLQVNDSVEYLDFGHFIKLNELRIDKMPLTHLDDCFYSFSFLREIYIRETQIQTLPFSLFCIGKTLDTYRNIRFTFSKNKIHSIGTPSPEQLFDLNTAVGCYWEIDLSENQLTEIPSFFLKLKIKTLKLNGNPIQKVPKELFLMGISEIDLSDTQITEIPIEVFQSNDIIRISNKNAELVIPDLDDLPAIKGYKYIYGKNPEQNKIINSFLQKK